MGELTSKEKVLHRYPNASCVLTDPEEGTREVLDGSGNVLGVGTNANQAWNNAAIPCN